MQEIKLKKKMLLGRGNERLRVLEMDGESVVLKNFLVCVNG